jgi:parvulin-like peptidyl-prolyl isomerase
MKMNAYNLVQGHRRVIQGICGTLLLLLNLALAYGQSPVGEVNGRQIDAAEYQRRVREDIASQQQYSYGSEVNEVAIRENIFNQMIDEMLLEQSVERLGLGISNDQLQQMLLNDPPEYLKNQFTDSSGKFDEGLYRRFMADPRALLAEYGNGPEEIDRILEQFQKMQKDYRKEKLQEAVEKAVTASSAPTAATAYRAFKDQESHATGSVAMFHIGMIDDAEVDVSDDEARAYFNAHSNDYRQPATREVNYISFPLVPSPRDSSAAISMLTSTKASLQNATTTEEKDALYDEWSQAHGTGQWYPGDFTSYQEIPVEIQSQLKGAKQGSIFGPIWLTDGAHLVEVVEIDEKSDPHVRAQHILLEEPQDGNVASVKALAKDIIKRAKAGESFDKLAEDYSNDPASSAQGGDLGYFGRGTMAKEFEDAAFKAKPGSIIGPIKTEYGYHIIKVNDRTTRNFKLRDWIITPRVSDETRGEIRRRAQEFRRSLKPGADLVEVTNQEGLELYTSGPVRRNQPVAGSMKLSLFAFNGTVGSLSEVTTVSDGGFAVAQVATIHNAGVMAYDDARDRVMDILRDGKKLDLLRDRAARFRAAAVPGVSLAEQNAIDSSASFESFDEISPRSVLEATESDTALVEALFSQKPGEISQPIRGREAYYIFLIDSRTVPTEQEFALRRDEFTEQLKLERSRPAFDEWLVTEREKAEIKDLRSE